MILSERNPPLADFDKRSAYQTCQRSTYAVRYSSGVKSFPFTLVPLYRFLPVCQALVRYSVGTDIPAILQLPYNSVKTSLQLSVYTAGVNTIPSIKEGPK
jgi:hypothetical protein